MGSIGEKHISRIAVPKTWPIGRRIRKWATRPMPGMHPINLGMPLNIVFKEILGYAKTTKEVKNILNNQEVLVDGRRRKDVRFIVGLMDVISLPKIKKYFRVLLNKNGKISLLPISESEAQFKLCKIKNKKSLKGKFQLNLHDGRNIFVEDKSHKIGSTAVIEIPSQKIKEIISLEKGVVVYLVSGKHVGSFGTLKEIKNKSAVVKTHEGIFETSADYAFVIGKDKPLISIEK